MKALSELIEDQSQKKEPDRDMNSYISDSEQDVESEN